MRLSNIFFRLRRPMTVLASVAVVALAYTPVGAPAMVAPSVKRIVATPVPVPSFTPLTLAIPKIGVQAPVVPVWTYVDGRMASPSKASEVGWWAGRKAGKGNLLLDGHHDWNGAEGSFYRLKDLKPGDQIIVKGKKDEQLVYRVTWIKNFDRNIDATDLLGNKNGQVATLITCGGTFDTIAHTHRERVVARAELVSV